MIRTIAKLCAIAVLLSAYLHVAPVFAASPTITYVSSTGVDTNPCSATQPCATLFEALFNLFNGNGSDTGQVNCLNPPAGIVELAVEFDVRLGVTIDCHAVLETSSVGVGIAAANNVVRILNLTISGSPGGGGPAITFAGSGTLILENCAFENFSGTALDIEPNGPLNLVIKNSRISNNTAAGVLIKPAAGGSVTATFDGVTITNNAGGLRTDTTNGAVRVDISDSTINNNANNGVIAIGGAGGQNVMNLSRNVIASNGQVGIEVSGTTAGAIVDTTLLDSNTLGALSAVSSGRILTYQNNRIVGSPGTGFTGTASPN